MLFGGTYEEIMAMINAIGAPVTLVDVEAGGQLVGLGNNSLAEELFGISNENFSGRNYEDLTGFSHFRRSRRKGSVSLCRRCIELGSQVVTETEVKLDDGTSRWGRHTFVPIFSESGEIRRIMITSIDITELKQTQHDLLEIMDRTGAPISIVDVTPAGRFILRKSTKPPKNTSDSNPSSTSATVSVI